MDLQSYEAEVRKALALLLNGVAELPDARRPEDVHQNVAEAHKHLHKLCKRYRRHRVFRYLIVFGEEQAVTAGFMSFDMVEKP